MANIFCIGPNSLRMHRQKCLDSEYVGEGNWGWTPERTSSASQILKGPLSVPHPKPKSFYRDAYGWGVWDIQEELDSLYHIKVLFSDSKVP